MNGCKVTATALVLNEKLKKNSGSLKVDVSFYRSLIGSLMYLTATRPDMMFAVGLLSIFMQEPSQIHLGGY